MRWRRRRSYEGTSVQLVKLLKMWRNSGPHLPSGSFRLGTMVRPSARFDIDIVVALRHGGARQADPAKLFTPPGWRLRGLATLAYSKRTRERVFDQILADMQEEWMEAMVADRIHLARWIKIRGYASLLLAVVAHLVALVGSKIRDIRQTI